VDEVSCSRVQGWAWSPDLQSTSVTVDIYNNNVLVGTAAANQFRPDLATLGSGNYGFDWAIPASVKPAQIRVFVRGTNSELTGSGVTRNCQ
jgi:hypothetical protein